MLKAERHDRILSELARRGAVGVEEMATVLGVSTATVRRDLAELEQQGLLRRAHGGATLLEDHDELPYRFKVTALLPEKRRIGATAAAMIKDGQVIACTGGTTVTQVIKALRNKRVTVVTNAVNVAAELASAPGVEVIVSGGRLRSQSYEMVGHVAERTIREFVADVVIIGVDGLSLEYGLTTFSHEEAQVNRAFIEQGRETWVVADHTKLGRVTPAVIAPIDRIRCLITDTAAPPDFLRAVEVRGVRTVTA